jgi:beta-mannosidase
MEDPFTDFNELKAEWIATKSWIYRTQFHTTSIPCQSKAVLAFDGLDTFAIVRLDGKMILKSDNMFLSHRVDVTEALQTQGQHDLEIEFEPALLKAREIQKSYPEHKWTCFNGESARLAVRKAQYHWGWDWGPSLMCAGIWKPIRLEVYTSKIDELRANVIVPEYSKLACIDVFANIETKDTDDLQATFTISLEGKKISERSCSISSDGSAYMLFKIESPSLWMPAGYGSQPLYEVKVRLLARDIEVHSESRRVGLRNAELVQRPDSHVKSFFFKINGVDVFCGGSCWIPSDSFLTNMTQERYRAWMKLMIPANQNMIRCVFPLDYIPS